MFDSKPHGKSQIYEQGTLWNTQLIHDDQSTSGISYREKAKKLHPKQGGGRRYFYSSESFTDHKVRISITVCSFRTGVGLFAKVFKYSFVWY